ncbi:lysozyme inhibitor LprI family protein, partial (plasmid) [Clostridium perfringens]
MKIIMENKNGVRKEVKEGFSWTTLFFRWLPSLLRGDLVSALKLFIIGSLTFGIYTDYKSYNINEDYYTFLTEKGYE